MKLDIEKYMPMLETLNISHAEKLEMLRTVWGIMESYIDHAYGIAPVVGNPQKKQNLFGVHQRQAIESSNTFS